MTILLKYFNSFDVCSGDLTDNTFEGGFINEL